MTGLLSTAGDLAVNLAASAIAAVAAVLVVRVRRRRRVGRLAGFLGVSGRTATAVLVVPGHPAGRTRMAVDRFDVAAMIEVAGLVREAGAGVRLAAEQERRAIGDEAEMCIAGPHANGRTAACLRNLLPGLTFDDYTGAPAELMIRVGGHAFARVKGEREYVVLARLRTPGQHPVLLISGQTSIANLAGAKYLAANVEALIKTYGTDCEFCLILRVVDAETYGSGWTELVADHFAEASRRTTGTSDERPT